MTSEDHPSLTALVQLARPWNVLIALLVVFVSFYLAQTHVSLWKIVLAYLVVALITGGGNALNDYFDLEVDRVNHPHRPLPLGKITPENAKKFAVLLMVMGIVLALPLGIVPLLISLFAIICLVFYNMRGKWIPVIGNLVVSTISGLVFLFIGAVANEMKIMIFPFFFAFLFHLAREIVKDVQDFQGDLIGNPLKKTILTLPHLIGKRKALLFSQITILVLIVVTLLPYLFGIFGRFYLLAVAIGVDLPLFFIVLLIHRLDPGIVSNILKVDIIAGLFALMLARY